MHAIIRCSSVISQLCTLSHVALRNQPSCSRSSFHTLRPPWFKSHAPPADVTNARNRTMSASDAPLRRAHVLLQEASDASLDPPTRLLALESARTSLIDARKASAPLKHVTPLLLTLLETAIGDAHPSARALVANVVEDFCFRDVKSFIVVCMPFLFRTLSDANATVIKRGIRVLTTLFRKVLGHVVALGVGPSHRSDGVFPEARLHDWLEVQKKVVNLMDSPDGGIQNAAAKFSETVVLALSYSDGRPSHDHFTLNYAASRKLDHPSLDLRALEAEGKRCVALVSGLVYAGLGIPPPQIPDAAPAYVPTSRISASCLMTALSVVGNLTKRREKIARLTVPPLILSVMAITRPRGRQSEMFASLPDGQRRSVIMTLRLTLHGTQAYGHLRTNADVVQATQSIQRYEAMIVQERNRAIKQQRAAAAAASRSGRPQMPSANVNHAVVGSKRPRTTAPPPPHPAPMKLVPANDAFHFAQFFVQSMHPHELAHFVITRLLLSTPPDPNAPPPPPRPRAEVAERPARSADPRRSKRSRMEETVIDPRKAAPVRRVAPPVVALSLSADGSMRLLHRVCTSLLDREQTSFASGAGPLRNLVLGKQLAHIALDGSELSRKLCEVACAFIVDKIEARRELALAWLHAVLFADRQGRTEEDIEEANEKLLLLSKHRAEALSVMNRAREGAVKRITSGDLVKSEDDVVKAKTPLVKSEDTVLPTSDPAAEPEPARNAQTNGADENAVGAEEAAPSPMATGMDVDLFAANEEEPALQPPAVYETLLASILDKLQTAGNDAAFIRMIVDAPVIPSSVIDMLHASCRDISRNERGLTALHDIVAERCGDDRNLALNIVLGLSVDADEVIRGPCIRMVADRLYSDLKGAVPGIIEKFAVDNLRDGIEKAEEGVKDLERCAWLFSTLVMQKHGLLEDMATCYGKAGEKAKEVLLKHGKILGEQLGTDSEPTITLIRGAAVAEDGSDDASPNGVEDLALTVLNGIIKKYGRPSRALVDAACDRFKASKDSRFLAAVLSGLDRDMLTSFLGDLVSLSYSPPAEENASNGEQEAKHDATKDFKQMVRTIMESQPPAISAAELLVELHSLPVSSAASNAVRACFELKVIFRQEIVAQALQSMIETTPVPSGLMDAVSLTREFHEDREKYLFETILRPLIGKPNVWKDQTLWEGFLGYCDGVKDSGRILLLLPLASLRKAFEKKPGLVEVFRGLSNSAAKFKKVVPAAKKRKVITDALGRA